MSNAVLRSQTRSYLCFNKRPIRLHQLPIRSLSTPGLNSKSLYRCYQPMYLKPGPNNFLYSTTFKDPAVKKEVDQVGHGLVETQQQQQLQQQPQQQPQIKEDPEETKGIQKKLTYKEILQKMSHPVFDVATKDLSTTIKRESTKKESGPKPKKQKTKNTQQVGGQDFFRFY